LHWATGSAPVEAKPFVLTDPVEVVAAPGRLQLWVTDSEGAVVARSFVDIA
jgi:hypothetical protein